MNKKDILPSIKSRFNKKMTQCSNKELFRSFRMFRIKLFFQVFELNKTSLIACCYNIMSLFHHSYTVSVTEMIPLIFKGSQRWALITFHSLTPHRVNVNIWPPEVHMKLNENSIIRQ